MNDEQIMLSLQGQLLEKVKGGDACGPFMAAIYDREGNLVVSATNSVVTENCSHNHAEMNAIRMAEEKFGTWDLGPKDLVLYTTSEPCMMCVGGILWSGVRKVVYGVPTARVEAIAGFDEGFKPNWQREFKQRGIEVVGPVAEEAGEEVFREYVRQRRVVYRPTRTKAGVAAPGTVDHVLRVKDITKPFDFDLSRPLEIEVGCGKGKFLTARAKANPDCDFLGIERMLDRVRLFDGKCRRGKIDNAKVLRLEALYTFHYLLPAHHARRVYVFFPDPWPKKKHHSHRLFGPLFLNALWKRLEVGGKLEFATDHREYFETVRECFAADRRFEEVAPMDRPEEVWTEFETMFRGQGLPIYSAAWRSLPADDAPLPPLTVSPDAEPREGIVRRCS